MGRYGIKEIFLTVQGEGLRAGAKSVFVRFSGCNLWDGHPLHRDRGIGACARWCDTDFFKGDVFSTDELLFKMGELWMPREGEERWVVFTGGEPCLQIDQDLMMALGTAGWSVAVETNGTVDNAQVESFADHITLSPKLDERGVPLPLALRRATEVKVVLPGAVLGRTGWTADQLSELEFRAQAHLFQGAGGGLFVQPQDPIVAPDFVEESHLKKSDRVRERLDEAHALALEQQYELAVKQCVSWVLGHPTWRLSVQTHKTIGMP